jgi:hypothetical protein
MHGGGGSHARFKFPGQALKTHEKMEGAGVVTTRAREA